MVTLHSQKGFGFHCREHPKQNEEEDEEREIEGKITKRIQQNENFWHKQGQIVRQT